MTKVRGLRGATTSDTDSRHDILTATENLLKELIKANDLQQDLLPILVHHLIVQH